ncbi:MAG: orotidine-5'-phosphate decarboxylase [Candidatus Brocadiia bacterium]
MKERHFADRLMAEIERKRSQVVVGLDPRVDRLPAEVREPAYRDHGETASGAAEAMVAFNRAVVQAVAEHAVAVKPQVAFYERFGVEGMRAYAATVRAAREAGLIVIADVKRNDIASTAAAYAAAHLGGAGEGVPHSDDFVVDALTVNPYLGSDGVEPFLQAAAQHGGGIFALVKTSNPSSADIQDVDCGGGPLYARVAQLVEQWGAAHRGASGYSLLGAVVGATYPEELLALRQAMPHAPLLVPGFGAQGGGVADVVGAFDEDGLGAVVNSSRGIIFAWQRAPYESEYGEARWRDAVGAAAADMRRSLWDATH